ncbi:MAG: serine/threonine protein kinase [Kiritimatiellae bacterium]|nr:serine/threonine protein kinase [Kiritimatiellia bacterium]
MESERGSSHTYLFEAGRSIGQYRILRPLGAGGMGEVYLAEHTEIHKQYALKVLPANLAEDDQFVARFRVEARVMADLEHTNIVRVHHMGREGDLFYLTMDFVDGGQGEPWALEDELEGGKRLPDERVRDLALQICDALAYAHGFRGEGVVHRDLKPSNILLAPKGAAGAAGPMQVKVADFGLAKVLGDAYLKSVIDRSVSLSIGKQIDVSVGDGKTGRPRYYERTSTRSILGTYEYMSPEQKAGGEVTTRSDIYTLGVLLYRMLTGRKPLGAYKPPSRFGVSRKWDAIVERCLQPAPEDRYAAVADLRAAIQQAGRRRAPAAAFIALGVLLLALAGLGVYPVLKEALRAARAGGGGGPPPVGKDAVLFTMTIDPPRAEVVITRKEHLIQHGRASSAGVFQVRLDPGTYTASVTRDGYRRCVQDFEVSAEHAEWSVKLSEIFGTVRITCLPGARVEAVSVLDGKRFGLGATDAAGLCETSLPVGEYRLVTRLEHYTTVTDSVTVAETKPAVVQPALEPLPGKVRILTPQPAEIWEGDTRLGGSGEIIGGLAVGQHTLELRSKGFKTRTVSVLLKPNGYAELEQRAFEPTSGRVRVDAASTLGAVQPKDLWPREAELRVGTNGWKTVTLPHTEEVRADLETELALRVNGYGEVQPQTVVVGEDGTEALLFKLTPEPGTVRILCEAPGAAIYREGTRLGKAGDELALMPFATHDLVMRAPGYRDGAFTVRLTEPGAASGDRQVQLLRAAGTLTVSAALPAAFQRALSAGEIRVDDGPWLAVQMPHPLPLEAGVTRRVAFRADGYEEPAPVELSLKDQEERRHTFVLNPLPGTITIRSNIPDAGVYAGGQQIGTAGQPLALTPFVRHTLEVRAPYYRSEQVTLLLDKPGAQHEDKAVRLEEVGAVLTVAAVLPPAYTQPARLDVVVDGVSLGAKPLPFKIEGLTTGRHTIELQGKIWQPVAARTVTVENGKAYTESFTLVLRSSYFTFSVAPGDAAVYVAGKRIQGTRVEVTAGTHEVEIRRRGYVTVSGPYAVGFGETRHLTFQLQKKPREFIPPTP